LAHYAKGTQSPAASSYDQAPRAPTACKHTVSGSFSLALQASFSPFPHGTGPLSVTREYLVLGGGPPSFPQGFSCPVVLGNTVQGRVDMFNYRTFTFSGRVFQHVRLYLPPVTSAILPNCPTAPHNTTAPTPAGFQCNGLDSSPFARRYSGNRSCFLFLRVLRWFSSPRSPPPPMDSGTVTRA
jgi:hypothetical protein